MYNTESMDQPSSAPHPTNSASSYETEKSVVPATGGLEPVPDHHNFPEAVVPYRFQGTNEALPPAGQSNGSGSMVCGLRRPTFILTVLLAAVVVIAAVAGGVGGSIAVKQAYDRGVAEASSGHITDPSISDPDDPDVTEAPSLENRIPPPPSYGMLELDCPNLTDTTHKVTPIKQTFTFGATCGEDYPTGGPNVDIISIVSYTLSDCMRACAVFNERNTVPDTKCVAVHFYADLKWIVERGGNCWLKSDIGKPVVDRDEDTKNLHVKADLED